MTHIIVLSTRIGSLVRVGYLLIAGSGTGAQAITSALSATAMRQALVSYLLGAAVLAISVNLVAGLNHLGS